MFTGLVECMGEIASTVDTPGGRRLDVSLPFAAEVRLGESVAINGCCLTAIACNPQSVAFEAGPETIRLTNLGRLAARSYVNLERSLKADGRLGGHLVQGHIDGMGELLERRQVEEWDFLRFEVGSLVGYMVPKGSIAIDGVSLTIVDVVDSTISVMLIPHTSAVTTLGKLAVGDMVNLEVDMIGKYVHAYLERTQARE